MDEYQDIGADQYELISALAGRTIDDEAGKLTVFAVGDDDQNIYAFNGASVEYIRRFQDDYGPRPVPPRRELPLHRPHHRRGQHRHRAGA